MSIAIANQPLPRRCPDAEFSKKLVSRHYRDAMQNYLAVEAPLPRRF
jgi:hypothetical protein